jgi:hypothetical protein
MLDDLRNDGNASMPEQVKIFNPWKKLMIIKKTRRRFLKYIPTVKIKKKPYTCQNAKEIPIQHFLNEERD